MVFVFLFYEDDVGCFVGVCFDVVDDFVDCVVVGVE